MRHQLKPCAVFTFLTIVLLLFAAGLPSAAFADAPSNQLTFYVGTYTRGASKGIYQCQLDLETGAVKSLGLAAESENPSFLAIHPSGRFVYAVNEVGNFNGTKSGAVSAFRVDPKTGKLALLNQESSRGAAPCHLVVDKAGKNVLVANYGGGSVAVLPIQKSGSLGKSTSFVQHKGSSVNRRRQTAPHAHSINLDPRNLFAFAADLGLDKLLIYRFLAEKGILAESDTKFIKVEPGAGPRHFAFHPGGKFAYVINELHLTVTAFSCNRQNGELKTIQTLSTVPADANRKGLSTAEVRVHPSGKFLYGSNRGHDSIVVFAIEQSTGRLTYVENEPTQGKTPRNFAIDPTGKFLLAENQGSNSIVVFCIDQTTGELHPTGHKVEVPTPVCIRFLETSK